MTAFSAVLLFISLVLLGGHYLLLGDLASCGVNFIGVVLFAISKADSVSYSSVICADEDCEDAAVLLLLSVVVARAVMPKVDAVITAAIAVASTILRFILLSPFQFIRGFC